jgi:hypothetical protein
MFEYLMRKQKFYRKNSAARRILPPKFAGLNKKTEIRELIADKNWKKLGWVLKKRKTGTGLICGPITFALHFSNKRRRHAFTH